MANLLSVWEYHFSWDRARKWDVEQRETTEYDDGNGNASRTGRIAGQEQPMLVIELGNPGRQGGRLLLGFPTHRRLLARNGTPSGRYRHRRRHQFCIAGRYQGAGRQRNRERLLGRML